MVCLTAFAGGVAVVAAVRAGLFFADVLVSAILGDVWGA